MSTEEREGGSLGTRGNWRLTLRSDGGCEGRAEDAWKANREGYREVKKIKGKGHVYTGVGKERRRESEIEGKK